MPSSLLTTKLYIPPSRPNLVSRPRLTERLNGAMACRLALVSAPAGFGKTTLVTEWLGNVGQPATWLSLDEADNDPARFFTYLVAALQEVDPNIGQAAQAMLQAPQPPSPESLLTSLINDIAATPRPFILVLDDYHLIHTLAIHQQLGFLLEHQPPQMHTVIATREDPSLPLSRLRARGQMMEIRRAELQFTAKETADFLRRTMRRELSQADIDSLQERTEGWAAGLQLVVLSMRGSGDVNGLIQSFTGSHRYILDYLIEEVFQQQPRGVQDFLLKTSILDRFTAPLCNAVTGRNDCRDLLFALEGANLFLFLLDPSRQWYRYHRLFADLLRHRLQVKLKGQVPRLHQKASLWYAANGLPEDAMRHALAASDWERAADLILSGTGDDLLNRGQMVTLLGWYRAIPEEVMRANPRLCVERSWPLILTGQIDTAESYLLQAEQTSQEQGFEDTVLPGAMATAEAYIARVRGDIPRVIELSKKALSLLPPDDLSARSVVAVNLGIVQWHAGRLTEAERALAEAQHAARGTENDTARVAALVFLNRLQVARGRLGRAAASCRQMIEQSGQLPMVALAHHDLGRLLYEWNELDTAADHLEQGIDLSRHSGNTEFLVSGCGTLAVIRQAQDDAAAAQDALQEATRLIEHPGISPATRLHVLASRILVALGQGDLYASSLAAEQSPKLEQAGSLPDYLFLMLARVRLLLAQGRRVAAAEQLAALRGMASRAGWESVAGQARALQALAAPRPDEAPAILTEALEWAEPEGYVRTFVDLGEPMAALLRETAARGIAPEYVQKLLAAFSRPPTPPRPHAQQLIDPLTDRELDVVRLLASGQTNQEIARALFVSVNTVRTHLKNIYGKLDVHNRREAAARAKRLGLTA